MLKQKNIIVTGATGMIGECLTKYLLSNNNKVMVAVRNIEKARQMFADKVSYYKYEFGSNQDFCPDFDTDIVFHLACPTASDYFVKHPQKTYDTIVLGTQKVLEFAEGQKVEAMVYASSMEIYGEITEECLVTEEELGALPDSPRSSYPLGKRKAEELCVEYARKHNVHVKIARLAQTIGRELREGDNRLIAQIARGIKNNTDLLLHTSGETSACRISVDDAISALLTLADKGVDGEAYNIANEDTYCSVKTMAENIYDSLGKDSRVIVKSGDSTCYPPTTFLHLDTSKIQALGWKPTQGLIEMFSNLVHNIE